MAAARHDWWLIGSVAVHLLGGNAGRIADIDILLDPRDCDAIGRAFGVTFAAGQADERFVSQAFAACDGVELMAGLRIRDGDREAVFRPLSRVEVRSGLFTPTREEMISILHRFGRPKDIIRAACLGV